MRISLFVIPVLLLFIISSGGFVFAESTVNVLIPSGASDPRAPYFWSEKSTGITTGVVTVYPGDTIVWHNADTVFHTITSGIAPTAVDGTFEEDGVFDSGFFTAGKSYSRQFNDIGDFDYYCSLHPYMTGVVHVIQNPGNVQTIDNVGSGYSDDGLGFEIKYNLDVNLQQAVHVNPDEKSLTFRISGTSGNDQITFVLPVGLIENPNAVLIDGEMIEFESRVTSSGTELVIPINNASEEIKIMGTKVIPEFGFLAFIVLSIGIMSMLVLTHSKLAMFRQVRSLQL